MQIVMIFQVCKNAFPQMFGTIESRMNRIKSYNRFVTISFQQTIDTNKAKSFAEWKQRLSFHLFAYPIFAHLRNYIRLSAWMMNRAHTPRMQLIVTRDSRCVWSSVFFWFRETPVAGSTKPTAAPQPPPQTPKLFPTSPFLELVLNKLFCFAG